MATSFTIRSYFGWKSKTEIKSSARIKGFPTPGPNHRQREGITEPSPSMPLSNRRVAMAGSMFITWVLYVLCSREIAIQHSDDSCRLFVNCIPISCSTNPISHLWKLRHRQGQASQGNILQQMKQDMLKPQAMPMPCPSSV